MSAADLTDEEREELRRALLRGPNATWIKDLPGPTDISGSFVPELAYTVELIVAAHVRRALEDAADDYEADAMSGRYTQPLSPPFWLRARAAAVAPRETKD